MLEEQRKLQGYAVFTCFRLRIKNKKNIN